jgi:XTP/dITP diphosphohydrolase
LKWKINLPQPNNNPGVSFQIINPARENPLRDFPWLFHFVKDPLPKGLDQMKIVFATHNNNKLIEVRSMLPAGLNITGLEEIGCFEEIPETNPTLEGNALQKARYIYNKYGCNCFSDDTGLEIEALDGSPGVISAIYAGEERNSYLNMQKVLSEMMGIENRRARFRTVIAAILNHNEYLFEGIAEGEIIMHPRGDGGFGYDPIFVPLGYKTTFAEMSLDEKNRISHRKKAFQLFADHLGSSGLD